jgi:hypothetical protein
MMPERLTPQEGSELKLNPEITQEIERIQLERQQIELRAGKLGIPPEDLDEPTKKNPEYALKALKVNADAEPRLMALSAKSRETINRITTQEVRNKVGEAIGEFEGTTLSFAEAEASPRTIMEWTKNLQNLHKSAFTKIHNAYPGITDHVAMRIGMLFTNSIVDMWLSHGTTTVLEEVGHKSANTAFGAESKIGLDLAEDDKRAATIRSRAEERVRNRQREEGLILTSGQFENLAAIQAQDIRVEDFEAMKGATVGELFLSSLKYEGRAFVTQRPYSGLSEEEENAVTSAGPNQHTIFAREQVIGTQKKGYFHIADVMDHIREIQYSPAYFFDIVAEGYSGDPVSHIESLMKQGKMPDLKAMVDAKYRAEVQSRPNLSDSEKRVIFDDVFMKEFRSLNDRDLKELAAFQLAQVVLGMADPLKTVINYAVEGKEKSELIGIKLPGDVFIPLPKIYTWLNKDSASAEVMGSAKIGDKTHITASAEKAFIGKKPSEITVGAEHRGDKYTVGGEVTANPEKEYYLKLQAEEALGANLSLFGHVEINRGTMRGEREMINRNLNKGIRGWLGMKYEF